MRTIHSFLLFIRSRCIGTYLLVAGILFLVSSQKIPVNNTINWLSSLKTAEFVIIDRLPRNQSISQQEYERAIRYYKKLEEIIGPLSHLSGNLGFCYHQIKNDDQALLAYANAIKLNPHIYTYYADTAIIYFKLKKFEDSLEHIEKAFNSMQETIQYYQSFFTDIITEKDDSLKKYIFLHTIEQQNIEPKEKMQHLFEKIKENFLILRDMENHILTFEKQRELSALSNQNDLMQRNKEDDLPQFDENIPLHFDDFFVQFFAALGIVQKMIE